MKKIDFVSYLPHNHIRFQQEELDSKGTLIFSGINHYALEPNTIISGVAPDQSIVSLDFQNRDIVIGNDKHLIQIEKDRINSKISFLQTAQEKALKIRLGTLETYDGGFFTDAFNLTYKTGILNLDVRPRVNDTGVLLSGEAVSAPNLVYNTGNQTISGNKTFINNISVSGAGIFNTLDLNDVDNLSLSGVDITIQNATVDLGNSKLINAVPEFINETTNFLISGNYNSRMIMVNSATEVTGTIISGNALGFNTTIMQVGSEQVLITGSGIGITINEYANQYRTAGAFAAVTLLHTGTNGYVMYGNTAS
jgi:hypothetical protein